MSQTQTTRQPRRRKTRPEAAQAAPPAGHDTLEAAMAAVVRAETAAASPGPPPPAAPEPAAPTPAAPAQGPARVLVDPKALVCEKCGGKGLVDITPTYGANAGKRIQVPCFRCKHDRKSPAKGYQDARDLIRNRDYDIDADNDRNPGRVKYVAVLVRKGDPDRRKAAFRLGETRTTETRLFVKRDTGFEALKPQDVKPGDTVAVPTVSNEIIEALVEAIQDQGQTIAS